LRLWPDNPRLIRPERLAQLKQALAADPAMLWARPLLALPNGTVIAGNQRFLAAVELGWQTIPALIVDLDSRRARVWALRDNKSYGEWDEPALAEILADLQGDGTDLALAGFVGRELVRILGQLQPGLIQTRRPTHPRSHGPNPERSTSSVRTGCCAVMRPTRVSSRVSSARRARSGVDGPALRRGLCGQDEAGVRIANDDAHAATVFARTRRPSSC
jgi:hypothetical protein